MTDAKLKELKELAEKEGWYAHRSTVLELIAEIERLKLDNQYLSGALSNTIVVVGPNNIPAEQMKENLVLLAKAGYTGDGVDGKGV